LLSVDVSLLCCESAKFLSANGWAVTRWAVVVRAGSYLLVHDAWGREGGCLNKLIVVVLARELMLLLKFGYRGDLRMSCACVGDPPSLTFAID
jgi:hypothetical protein